MNRTQQEVCLGITVDQEMIQVAVLDAYELETPWPLELRSFSRLAEFESYWLDHLDYCYRVSLINLDQEDDDLGLIDWLSEMNLQYDQVRHFPHLFYTQLHVHRIPKLFECPYAAALGCVMRANAATLANRLVDDAVQLGSGLRDLIARLECLKTVLPPEPCPF